MKRQILLISFLCLIVLIKPCFAKEWHNIFPLKTTRSEVIKLLGKPAKEGEADREYFQIENGQIMISWALPNCYAQNLLSGDEIKSDSVVYQITFVPKAPLPIKYVEKLIKQMQSASELFFVYEGECLKGGNGTFSCGSMSSKYGFGYSHTNNGVSALYFFPTEKESTEWKERLKPCSAKQK